MANILVILPLMRRSINFPEPKKPEIRESTSATFLESDCYDEKGKLFHTLAMASVFVPPTAVVAHSFIQKNFVDTGGIDRTIYSTSVRARTNILKIYDFIVNPHFTRCKFYAPHPHARKLQHFVNDGDTVSVDKKKAPGGFDSLSYYESSPSTEMQRDGLHYYPNREKMVNEEYYTMYEHFCTLEDKFNIPFKPLPCHIVANFAFEKSAIIRKSTK